MFISELNIMIMIIYNDIMIFTNIHTHIYTRR